MKNPSEKKSILILDTDVGTDDAFAFLFLKTFALSPDYIIATGGNTTLMGALQNAVVLMETVHLSASLVVGENVQLSAEKNTFHGIDGLAGLSDTIFTRLNNGETRLAQALSLRTLCERLHEADEIRYIVIGPLTSLSVLLDQPGIREKITEIDLMGGGLQVFNCAHETEFNFSKNPSAVQKVLHSGCPITLFPLDLTNTMTVSAGEIDALSRYGTYPDFISFLQYNLSSNDAYNQIHASVLHDAMPILYLHDPAPFRTEDRTIACDALGHIYEDHAGTRLRVALHADRSVLLNALRESFSRRRIQLRPFEDADIPRFERWLKKPHVKPWFGHFDAWMDEVMHRKDRFSFIHHFIAEAEGRPIGFCQYYDYNLGGESWHGNTDTKDTYSIDYLIGEEDMLRRHLSREMLFALEERIWQETEARKIIVQPERDNEISRHALLAAEYEYDAQNDFFIKMRRRG